MKRKSDFAKHQLPKNYPHDDSEFEFVKRQAKRNFTTFKNLHQSTVAKQRYIIQSGKFRYSQPVVNGFLFDLIDNLHSSIQKIQKKRLISSAVNLTNSIGIQLLHLQDPENQYNEVSRIPQQQPVKNSTDPISGFNKQNFIKKQIIRQKHHDDSTISLRQTVQLQLNSIQNNVKKLPPLMKQLSQQKLQNAFVPLDQMNSLSRKKSTLDFEQMVRQRLLKQIQNRKFKERIQAISTAVQSNQARSNSKKNSKSTYQNLDKILKQDCNFDYDGNKISIFSHGKVKSNIKILKALYKIPKQRVQDKKSKLQKKFHQRISYMPRCSRNYMQINNKTIADFGDLNYSTALKQKLQIELRKTEIKFNQKQFFGKERQKNNSILA